MLLDEVSGEFLEQAHAQPLDHTFVRTRDGKTFTFTRGAVLTHVTTHAMHHRALMPEHAPPRRRYPLPPSGVVEWVRWVDAAQK